MPISAGAEDLAGILPTGHIRHLVMAAVGSKDAAAHWAAYRRQCTAGHINIGEMRLFPLVARHVDLATLPEPERKQIAAMRQRAFMTNSMLLEAAGNFSKLCKTHDIPVAFRKGPALIMRCYRRAGLRQTSDLDIYAEPEAAAALLQIAPQFGLTSCMIDPEYDLARLRHGNGVTLRDQQGYEFDLRCHPSAPFRFREDLLARFYAEMQSVDWRGRLFQVPSDTWMLLEILEHGLCRNLISPIRWVADAHELLAQPDCAVDWDDLIQLAETVKLTELVRLGLDTLAETGAPVPARALDEIRRARTSRMERRDLWAKLKVPHNVYTRLYFETLNYVARAEGTLARKLVRYPGYLRSGLLAAETWGEFVARGWSAFRRRTVSGKG